MTNRELGFLLYLHERSYSIEKAVKGSEDYFAAFAKECEKCLQAYKAKYPNGLTNCGHLIDFKD